MTVLLTQDSRLQRNPRSSMSRAPNAPPTPRAGPGSLLQGRGSITSPYSVQPLTARYLDLHLGDRIRSDEAQDGLVHVKAGLARALA